jgi:hypothetical protein
MKNKLDAQTRVIQQIINETMHLRELGVGTLETVKLMPGYEDAIKGLQEKMEEEVKQKQQENKDGVIKQDIK